MIVAGLVERLRAPRRSRATPRRSRATPRRSRATRPVSKARRRGVLAWVRLRVILVLAALLLLFGGGWLWLRDSSLVAVTRVSISGAMGPQGSQIQAALTTAARNMTTLDVRMKQLRMAVAPFPVVKDIRVSTQFPHGISIRVIEEVAVAEVLAGGRSIPVAGDGTLLPGVAPGGSLPSIPLNVPPGGTHLRDPGALGAAELLAAAPRAILGRVTQATTVAPHGLVVQLRDGPNLYFGDTSRLTAKWLAAAAVLSDPGSTGAAYIDLTDPERPAAGSTSSGSTTGTGGSPTGTGGGSAAGTGGSATGAGGGSTTGTGGSPTGTGGSPTGTAGGSPTGTSSATIGG